MVMNERDSVVDGTTNEGEEGLTQQVPGDRNNVYKYSNARQVLQNKIAALLAGRLRPR